MTSGLPISKFGNRYRDCWIVDDKLTPTDCILFVCCVESEEGVKFVSWFPHGVLFSTPYIRTSLDTTHDADVRKGFVQSLYETLQRILIWRKDWCGYWASIEMMVNDPPPAIKKKTLHTSPVLLRSALQTTCKLSFPPKDVYYLPPSKLRAIHSVHLIFQIRAPYQSIVSCQVRMFLVPDGTQARTLSSDHCKMSTQTKPSRHLCSTLLPLAELSFNLHSV